MRAVDAVERAHTWRGRRTRTPRSTRRMVMLLPHSDHFTIERPQRRYATKPIPGGAVPQDFWLVPVSVVRPVVVTV